MNELYLRVALPALVRDSFVACLQVAKNGFALIGLVVVSLVVFVVVRAESVVGIDQLTPRALVSVADSALRAPLSILAGVFSVPAEKITLLLGLGEAQALVAPTDLAVNEPARLPLRRTALPPDQRGRQAISTYLVRKYRLSPAATDLLVAAAYETGRQTALEPALLLAVMAIESGFNPFAESVMGAQGLMQVMTKIHRDKLEDFGGSHAALNPVANMKVGAIILKDCIRRGGSVLDGLRLYSGSGMGDDGGYGSKVLQEKERIAAAAMLRTMANSAATAKVGRTSTLDS